MSRQFNLSAKFNLKHKLLNFIKLDITKKDIQKIKKFYDTVLI